MKQLKKQVLLLLCMVCLFLLAACGTVEENTSIDPGEAEELQESTIEFLKNLMNLTDSQMRNAIEQYRSSGMEGFAAGLESYMGMKDELGEYVSTSSAKAEKNDDGYTITLDTVFEKRDCYFVLSLDDKMSMFTSVAFNPVYSMKENMVKAGLNTLMGMGTVFLVLIFISWIISCFRYINRFGDKEKVPAPVPMRTRETALASVPGEVIQREDDLELVAVIAAAIAAASGTSPDGLVVRSIRRVSGNEWKKA